MGKFIAILVLAGSFAVSQASIVHNAEQFVRAVEQGDELIVVDGTIIFNSADSSSFNALPILISDKITIKGRNDALIKAGAEGFRFAEVGSDAALHIAHLTISGFSSQQDGGAIVVIRGSLSLEDVTLADNSSQFAGGAIAANHASIHISNSVLKNNSAQQGGGAIAANYASIHISDSTLKNNSAQQRGGAISAVFSSVDVLDSLLKNNSAQQLGGALYLHDNGGAFIFNSRLVGNQAPQGCTLVHTHFALASFANSLIQGSCVNAQVWSDSMASNFYSSSLVLESGTAYHLEKTRDDTPDQARFSATIVGQIGANTDPLCEIKGTAKTYSYGFNLAEDKSCELGAETDRETISLARILEFNGVPTPVAGSAALDAIKEVPGNCYVRDVTGLGRPQDGDGDGVYACDIGAVEKQGGPDIGPAMTGVYFDPSRNGEGYFIEMLGNNRAWVTFFSYTQMAAPATVPNWFFGVGEVVGNSIIVDDFYTVANFYAGVPAFGDAYDPDQFNAHNVGSLSLVFSNCNSTSRPGRAYFSSNGLPFFQPYSSVLTRTARLSRIVGCNGQPTSAKSGLSGTFFSPRRSGEGIIVQWLSEDRVFAAFYTFTPEHFPLWMVSGETVVDGNTVSMTMYYPAVSTAFGVHFDEDQVKLEKWGTVTLDYTSCDSMQFSYDSNLQDYGSGQYTYQRLTHPAGTQCSFTGKEETEAGAKS